MDRAYASPASGIARGSEGSCSHPLLDIFIHWAQILTLTDIGVLFSFYQGAIVLLASDAGGFITGSNIIVDVRPSGSFLVLRVWRLTC